MLELNQRLFWGKWSSRCFLVGRRCDKACAQVEVCVFNSSTGGWTSGTRFFCFFCWRTGFFRKESSQLHTARWSMCRSVGVCMIKKRVRTPERVHRPAAEVIGSTQYLNKSRACENLRFYFPLLVSAANSQNKKEILNKCVTKTCSDYAR